jgi:hypothetical protein
MWHLVAGDLIDFLVKPNIGRWGSVGDAAVSFLENWDEWEEMVDSIITAVNLGIRTQMYSPRGCILTC